MTEISDTNPNLISDPNPISIPPLDPLFLSDPMSDLDFLFDDNNGSFTDFDFTLDDFDFDNLDANPIPEPIVNPSEEQQSDSVHSQISSQGSKTLNSSSPEPSKSSLTKRKKESGDESRSVKYQKSESIEDDDDKKKVRLIRNRESAQLSRLRKKQYVEELQGKVKSMNSTIAELNNKISYVMAENVALKQQMAIASGAPPPPMMNPYMVGPPLPYQWMPYPVRGYGGSMTPLVPIPKLNPKPASSSCRPKKVDGKKSEGKSKVKKVASVSFIGVLFFVFLFGTLVPFMNVGESGGGFSGLSSYEGRGSRYYDEHKGRVLMVGDGGGSDVRSSRRSNGERDSCGGVDYNGRTDVEGGSSALGNASEPLFASLYVPRNDGLVKIDGNLIIHSVLASEKAKNISETVKSKEPGLTVPGGASSALAVPEVRGNGELLLHSPEGKRLHQWFYEGGSGTLMDYSMCTEVFQFDVAPGAIVPSSVSNITREHLQNVTTGVKRMKNRRTLQGLPVSLVPSELNITDTDPRKDAQNKSFSGNTNNKPKSSSSSMVVSVLLDPREIVDPESDRVIPPNPKSLSRIFVVVLLDSVKYVTYSCVLPRSGLHLVAT